MSLEKTHDKARQVADKCLRVILDELSDYEGMDDSEVGTISTSIADIVCCSLFKKLIGDTDDEYEGIRLVDFQAAIKKLRRDWLFQFDDEHLGDIELDAYAHALAQLEVTAGSIQAARNLAMVLRRVDPTCEV